MARSATTAARGARQRSYLVTALLALVAFSAFTGVASANYTDTGATGPWIQSDKADYAPGSTVVLTGGAFQADETVHITVNDTLGKSWVRDADVTADANGGITDSFSLPTRLSPTTT